MKKQNKQTFMYSESYEIPRAKGNSEIIQGLSGLKNSTVAQETNQWTASVK